MRVIEMAYWVQYVFKGNPSPIRENLFTDSIVTARKTALGVCMRSGASAFIFSGKLSECPTGEIFRMEGWLGAYAEMWIWKAKDAFPQVLDKSGGLCGEVYKWVRGHA